jgi:hypothetical protein
LTSPPFIPPLLKQGEGDRRCICIGGEVERMRNHISQKEFLSYPMDPNSDQKT